MNHNVDQWIAQSAKAQNMARDHLTQTIAEAEARGDTVTWIGSDEIVIQRKEEAK